MTDFHAEHVEHPQDTLNMCFTEMAAIIRLIEGCYDGKINGKFKVPASVVSTMLHVISDKIDHAKTELDRLTDDYDIPFQSKAEIAAARGNTQ